MAYSAPASDLYGAPSASNVTAVLGPTNTGKTHLAIERMLGHQSGLIGLPLRLLAREVYDRIVARIGPHDVALITGEEKIKPKNARYWVSTVEAMPRDLDVEFVAIDEIQLAGDPERGHVFTDRLFHARGSEETLLLGAETMRNALMQLLPGVNFISRPRLSKLSYVGPKKISRLPRRSAIVAFSVPNVYEIAEFVRRQRGGAAVVLGALSPRTRNAQVEMFQSGDVDFLIATDAIGMGLNLDVHHVAFAGIYKFDGQQTRELAPQEMAQIAGRAGRHIQDGTFGVTGDVQPLESDVINRIEDHDFDSVSALQWRARSLDFSSAKNLLYSLKQLPNKPFLMKARDADDVLALEALMAEPALLDLATGPANVKRLWEICQIPDYRKIGPSEHSDLVKQLFLFLMKDEGCIPVDWMSEQIDQHARIDGDIDTIATRIAHIRTWTFVANRVDWLEDPDYWQERTRKIEDMLSDAMHEALTQRFVDQRTSTLMKRLHEKDDLFVEIIEGDQVFVEDHFVGKISGFQFTPDSESSGLEGRAARSAAFQVLTKELAKRAKDMIEAEFSEFRFDEVGKVFWNDQVVGQLEKGDHILRPKVTLLADEQLSGQNRTDAEAKLSQVVESLIGDKLGPLVQLEKAEELTGMARGLAFQLVEQLGVLLREPIAEDVRQLDQEARKGLRKYGVRFGAFNIFFPLLLKPAAAEMARLLWLIKHQKTDAIADWMLPRAGLTSSEHKKDIPTEYYRVSGFHVCGGRVVRVDMLERLSDIIRPLVHWRSKPIKTDVKKTDENILNTDAASSLADKKKSEVRIDVADAETNDSLEAHDKIQTEPQASQLDVKSPKVPASDAPAIEREEKPNGTTGDGGFFIIPDMMSIMGCSADELGEILRSLGFQPSKVASSRETSSDEKEITPKQKENDKETLGSPQESTNNMSLETHAAIEKASEVVADEATANGQKTEDETSSTEVIIWRPRKKSGMRRSGARKDNRHDSKNSKARNAKSHRKGNSDHKPRGKKPSHNKKSDQNRKAKIYSSRKEAKSMDPDSPFAKLQALKDQIEDKAG